MKRNSLILLILISLNIYCQDKQVNNIIIEVFQSLPDSLFPEKYSKLTKNERNLLIELYKNKEYEIISGSNGEQIELEMLDNRVYIIIDFENGLMRISDNRSDISVKYELKLYYYLNSYLCAYSVNYSTHLTMEAEIIKFFKFWNNKFTDITKNVLNSFNYKIDNYNDTIINEFNKICNCDFRINPKNIDLVYKFTETDTVMILDNFIVFNYKYNPNIKVIHKYIMDNGKLRLAK